MGVVRSEIYHRLEAVHHISPDYLQMLLAMSQVSGVQSLQPEDPDVHVSSQ